MRPGDTIARYTVQSRLGAGGMGEVWLARDNQLDRPVALKFLPPEFAADAERMRRFRDEARAASALNHPNVAHIYEYGESDGVWFIAMEYVEGEPLSARLQRGTPTVDETLDIAAQTADALAEAHDRGIVHRDIKPANIMITPRGQVKVLDFGLAKRLAAASAASDETATRTEWQTEPGVTVGTVPYMSPEQALGKALDQRTDIFSFGAVLYQVITGRLPFSGVSTPELLVKIASEQPEPVSRLNAQAPADIERIIRKCLEKDPARRYQSARELVVDLKNLVRDRQSGLVTSPTVTAVTRRPPARRAFLLAAAIAVVGIASLAAVYLRDGGGVSSVAVLPFTNATGDASLEYLADGLTEQIINSLAQLPNLKVSARGTVFMYKGKPADPREVGKSLTVSSILTGRLTRHDKEFQVQVDLVDTAEGRQLWGRQFRRAVDEAALIEQEIVAAAAGRLSANAETPPVRKHPVNPEAYRLYLQGRKLINDAGADGPRGAIETFQKAVALDSSYAAAYAGLADGYSYLGHSEMVRPVEVFPKAKAAAETALRLDPNLAEAHTSLGLVRLLYEWDWEGAERALLKARELSPSDSYSRHWYAHYLEITGRLDEAIAELKRCRDLDPLSPMLLLDSTLHARRKGRQAEAIREVKSAMEFSPSPFFPMVLAILYLDLKQNGEAAPILDKMATTLPPVPFAYGVASQLLARAGRTGEARKRLAQLDEMRRTMYVGDLAKVPALITLGEKERAIEAMQKGFQERSSQLLFALVEPDLDPVKSDPRVKEIIARLKMPRR